MRKRLCLILTIVFILEMITITGGADGLTTLTNYNNTQEFTRQGSYKDYLAKYWGAPKPDTQISLNGNNYFPGASNNIRLTTYNGEENIIEVAENQGKITWVLNIPQTGLYNLGMRFMATEGKGKDIRVSIKIDDNLPFDSADSFIFKRVWKDKTEILQDSRGNDVRPKQEEVFAWQEEIFKNSHGVYYEECLFYFTEGEHYLTLGNEQETFLLGELNICQTKEPPPYQEYKKNHENSLINNQNSDIFKVQGENTHRKSDSTLFPMPDRSGPSIEPSDPKKIRLNVFGSLNWKYPGQYATWKIEAPEKGFYKISFKVKQDFNRGMFSSRRIYIDGQVPFKEVGNYGFKYDTKWYTETLGNEEGEPYLFYLEKGIHELKMEVVTGEIGETLKVLETVVFQLNNIYRRIIKITSVNPDNNRDYKLEEAVPTLLEELEDIRDILALESQKVVNLTKSKGSEVVRLDRMKDQLDSFIEEPDTIPSRLSNFSSNISAIGSLLLNLKEQPLTIDYILVAEPDKEIPSGNASKIEGIMYGIHAFLASFSKNHKQIGDVQEGRSIEVWVTSSKLYNVSGRDTAQIIKSLTDELFTPEKDIVVNVSLIENSLIQATLAGTAPDIAVNVAKIDPINLAMRGALMDLNRFSGFEDVTKRFYQSAIVPFIYKEDCYALPETQNFNMLFYRKDIFEELGIDVPQTWDEFYKVLSVIQKNNFQVGIGIEKTGETLFESLLFQRGLPYYTGDLQETTFTEPDALEAFKQWTGFYMNYSLPLTYDFYTRFRNGEMPMAFAPYTEYNRLTVAAPELDGLWGFVPIPGVMTEGEVIDKSQSSDGTACIMLKETREPEASWEYIKWWTSDEIQELFGREIEALVGPSARYNTANKNAFEKLPWSLEEISNLKEQWGFVKNNYQIPGNYYISRNILNAFRSVVYNFNNPRVELNKYNVEMNKEIIRKGIEFGSEKK